MKVWTKILLILICLISIVMMLTVLHIASEAQRMDAAGIAAMSATQ